MKKQVLQQLLWYGIFLIVSIFIIFFLGKTTDETGTVKWTVKLNAVEDFRLGMDIAGGTRLTYKLDFSKYRQIYTNDEEFQRFRRNTLALVQRNIAKRVDGLGVSDTNVYLRNLDRNDYLVVELGGVDNQIEAQEAIGKTVELQFKMPANQDSTLVAQRETVAKNALSSLQEGKIANLEDLSTTIGISDTYYQKLDKTPISQLPMIYSDNAETFANLEVGKYSMFDGVYFVSLGGTFGSAGGVEVLSGFTIFTMLDKSEQILDTIPQSAFVSFSESRDLLVDTQIASTNYNIDNSDINRVDGRLIYNGGEMFSGEKAYKLTLYRLDKPNLIGVSPEDQTSLQTSFDQSKNQVLTSLEQGNYVVTGIEGLQSIYTDTWQGESTVQQQVLSFRDVGVGIQTFDDIGSTFIAYVSEIKQPEEKIFTLLSIPDIVDLDLENLKQNLKIEQLYSIEELFIKDMPTWQVALDPTTNEVLNAAYFSFAEVTISQTGQPVVVINFDQKGKEIFCRISEVLVGQPMAIFIGESNVPVTAPIINERICGGQAQISGGFTPEDARKLARDLNEGAFPVSMTLEGEETVSPALGSNVLRGSLIAGGVGLLMIFVFLFFMYGIQKAIVGLAVLCIYLIYLLAVLKLPFINYAFSLSGMAAIILALGMGVDANILIFERVREELSGKNKNIIQAINTGVAKSWSSIKDGNLSTGLIAMILFMSGLPMFTGFGTMIIIMMLLVLLINVPLTQLLLIFVMGDNSSDK